MQTHFSRTGSKAPRYSRLVTNWLRQEENRDRSAVGENLCLDHRISPERDEDFFLRMGLPCGGDALEAAIYHYHETQVRRQPNSSFLNDRINGQNIVGGAAPDLNAFSSSFELAHVTSLNTVFRALLSARRSNPDVFADISSDLDCDLGEFELTDWLDHHLERRSSDYIERFVERVLYAMNGYRHIQPKNPVWVAPWSRFEAVKNDRPERWTELVGVPRFSAPQWLIVLHYTAADVGTLVRPTQFDAGWFAYHFPSPPSLRVVDGGVVLDLNINPHLPDWTPEYIHEQIDFELRFWSRDRLLRRTASRIDPGVVECRRHHWVFLGRQWGQESMRTWQAGNCQ